MNRRTKTMSFRFNPATDANARSLFEPESINDCPEGYTLTVWGLITGAPVDTLNLRAKVDYGGLSSFGQAVSPTVIDLSQTGNSLYVGGMSSVSIYYEKDPVRVGPDPTDDNAAIVSGALIPGGSRTCEATLTDWPRTCDQDPDGGGGAYSIYLPIPNYGKRLTVLSVDNPPKDYVILFYRGVAHTIIGNTGLGAGALSKSPVQTIVPSYSDSFRVYGKLDSQFAAVFSIVT